MPITWKQGHTQKVFQPTVSKVLSREKAVNIETVVSEQILGMGKGRHTQEGGPSQEFLYPKTSDHTADQSANQDILPEQRILYLFIGCRQGGIMWQSKPPLFLSSFQAQAGTDGFD